MLILIIGVLIYSNTFNASFHFDDSASITENPAIKHIQNIRAVWGFHPPRFLTYLSFAINYHFRQLNVFGYHLINLLIHILASIIVYFLVLLTFETPAMKDSSLKRYQNITGLFSALLFLTHPIQTQAVTYIVQRAASLAALFYLPTLLLYVRFRLTKRPIYYILSFITAFLGIFTKEIFITIPLAILLYEVCFFEKGALLKKIKFIFPYLLVILLIPLIMSTSEVYNLGEAREITRLSEKIPRKDYLLTEFNVIPTYIRLLVFPINQNLDYDYPIYHSLNLPTILSLLFLLSILGFGIYLFKRKPLLSFGIFFFFLTLSVESSIFPIPDVIFEHRLYLPCFGFCIFLSSLLMEIIRRKRPYIIFLSSIVITLSFLTYTRNLIWKDDITLWKDVVKKSPNKARAYNNLGLAYYRGGHSNEALACYRKAIEIRPNNEIAYNNIGIIYKEQDKLDEAIEYYEKALRIRPEYFRAHNNLGVIYDRLGQNEKAIQYYQKAIELEPDYAEACNNLGLTYDELGQHEKAIQYYRKAIELKPEFAEAYYNLGLTHGRLGQYEKAIQYYQNAIELGPGYVEAYNNLGTSYGRLGQYEKAIQYCQKAIELSPDFAKAYSNLGVTCGRLGQYEKAIQYYQKAIELEPDYAEVYYNLGVTYDKLGQYEKAIRYYQKAIELEPELAEAYYTLGIACGKLGQYEKVIQYCQKAIELDPEHAEAYYNLGIAYLLLGQNHKAREHLAVTLKLYRQQGKEKLARELEVFLRTPQLRFKDIP